MKQRRGELTKVSTLFDKYVRLLVPPQSSVEKVACEVINAHLRCVVTVEQVTYTVPTRTLYVAAPALYKQEVRMQHDSILGELRQRLGPERCPLTIL